MRAQLRAFRLPFSLLTALSAVACASQTSISTTSPSAAKCQVTADSASATVPAVGATGSVAVTTTRDCTWDASSMVNWIALTSAVSGQGSGTVSYRVDANGVPASRRGTIDVNGTQISVSQDAAPCRFTVSPLTSSVSESGGSVSIDVQTLSGCSWIAASETPWIHVASGASATAPGVVKVSVDANASAARTGSVMVAGQTVTINQSALAPTPTPTPTPGPTPGPTPPPAPCTYAINPSSYSASAGSSTGSIAVTTGAGCAWNAASNANWITFTGAPSSTGSGSLGFSVAANAGAARTGTATVAGQTFTVSQAAAGCTFAIAPAGQSLASGGGTGSFSVTAGGWCEWTAAPSAWWISISGGFSGSGNGTVAFSVQANSGSARTAAIDVSGQTFTISQAAPPPPCAYSISPSSANADASGGSGSVTVTTTAQSCPWTAASNNSGWLTVTSGSSGQGNGSVGYSAAANTGAARSGAITIGGQTFTVNQAAAPPPPCTYSISPTSQTVATSGGGGTVTITASDPSCGWTSQSNDAWLSIASGTSGTGSGSVTFSAAPMGEGGSRTGTLTIAGQTFTVNQSM